MLKAAKAYLATQVTTASQGDLLLMLYDTAIKHLNQAMEKMRQGDVAAKGMLISKAISIISELQQCLNKERGGDISKNLCNLYFYCNTRLLTANLKMKPEMVEEVITILSGLRQAFAQILPTQEGVASLAQPGAAPGAETSEVQGVCAPADGVVTTDAPVVMEAPAAPEAPHQAPMNTLRLRAASAYGGGR